MEFGVFLCVPSLEDITIFKFQFIFCEYICLLLSACTLLMLFVASVNNKNNISRVLIFASLIFRISAKKQVLAYHSKSNSCIICNFSSLTQPQEKSDSTFVIFHIFSEENLPVLSVWKRFVLSFAVLL